MSGTQPAVRVQGLSKQYQVGPRQTRSYQTLRESITAAVAGAARRLRRGRLAAEPPGLFWALKDVSFEVQPGEVIGVIGRNGSGKSTLLKILSRIVEPTAGRVEVRGRMASLLEVDTGFHAELTGRENIYLSGSILGMSRKEIDQQFDAIVAFSEIEEFLDTPVKRYSSGMYVRLAFAVGAHLRPEILVIDEILAVGDAQFQKKCLGKMKEVRTGGRTVLYVSHQMATVEAICDRCVLLRRGELVTVGPTREVVERFQSEMMNPGSGCTELTNHPGRTGGSQPIMKSVGLHSGDQPNVVSVPMGSPLDVAVSFESPEGVRPVLGVVLRTGIGSPLFGVSNRIVPGYAFNHPVRQGTIECRFDRLTLMPGWYSLDLYFGDGQKDIDIVMDAITFEVTATDVYGNGQLPPRLAGPFYVMANFALRETASPVAHAPGTPP